MRKIRKGLAFFQLLVFMITALLSFPASAQAATPVINSVFIGKTYNEALSMTTSSIEITGSDLTGNQVWVRSADNQNQVLGTDIGALKSNTDSFLKFELSGAEMQSIMWTFGLIVGGVNVTVDDANMASIAGLDKHVAYAGLNTPEGTITISGDNLNKDQLEFVNGSLSRTESIAADKIIIHTMGGDLGMHGVLFKRENNSVNVSGKVTISKLYQNQFRLVNKISIPDLTMRPNKGVAKKTTVFFEAADLDKLAVFFVKSSSDAYLKANMGTDHAYYTNPAENDLIKVNVPDLLPGTYKVILTNFLTNPADGVDLRPLITKELIVGDFIIVAAQDAPEIMDVAPNEGPNQIQNPVKVTGRNFEELKIDELIANDSIYTPTVKDNDKVLELAYDVTGATYKPNPNDAARSVTNLVREIKVIIGGQATFLPASEQTFLKNNNYDILQVMTATITDAEIQNDAFRDVVVEITTTIIDSTGEKHVFTELVIKEKGFHFLKSYTAPTIDKITPNRIQVKAAGADFLTKEEMYIGIAGKDFMVGRHIDPITRVETIVYPRVNLGGEIIMERIGDIVKINNVPNPNASLEVYDGATKADGSTGKEFGKNILIKIPADIGVKNAAVNHPTYVEVTNPQKNSLAFGFAVRKLDVIEFITAIPDLTPVINKVEPDMISVDGAKAVKISGYNFLPDVELYLEDKLISCTRSQNGQEIVFDAPAWREGKTRILVMNKNGGMASAPFTYIRSISNPKIFRVTPPEGVINSLVTIDGDGFLFPDPTADLNTEIGIYRLIGSRVLLGTRDINDYHMVQNKITLQSYSSNADDKLLQIIDDEAVLADYYHSLILEDSQGNFYVIRYNDQGQILLTNGRNNYLINKLGSGFEAIDGDGNHWSIDLNQASLKLSYNGTDIDLTFKTPYLVDSATNKITGNRVKVVDRGKRIMITIPNLQIPGLYDVTVINPDTNRDTLKDGFRFRGNPSVLPAITAVIPDQGAVGGGYFIRIEGENFEDNGTVKTRVFINGIEIAKADTKVSIDGKSIDVKVPPFPGDLRKDWGVSKKSVPIAVLNPSDGGSVGKENAFTYVVPGSEPVIDNISPNFGSGAGDTYVLITGRDFRYYEPYEDENHNFKYDVGEPYRDIDNSGDWTDLSDMKNTSGLTAEQLRILPVVYFGEKQAVIKDFGRGYIGVLTPPGKGKADVYLFNNDYGISNRVAYDYKTLDPKIVSVVPNMGSKFGNELVKINGQDFGPSKIWLTNRDSNDQEQRIQMNQTLVRFGEISNRNETNSGLIIGGELPLLVITGGMKLSYSVNDEKLHMEVTWDGKVYSGDFQPYKGEVEFFDLNLLEDNGEAFPGHELVRVGVENQRLIVERGYAVTDTINSNELMVTTPPYYTVGKVPLTIINGDGTSVKSEFTYKNPATAPVILNITRDKFDPEDINGNRVVMVNYKGQAKIDVYGEEFLPNAKIQIVGSSNVITIEGSALTFDKDKQIYSFIMPAVSEQEIDKLLPLVLTNEDGGVAWSDKPPVAKNLAPLYIQFTKGETEPGISGIVPDKGPEEGGTWVIISGKDFREMVRGYGNNDLKVIFGDTVANDVYEISYDRVVVKSPKHEAGSVDVRVENPDGTFSIPMGKFLYVSKPIVDDVVKGIDNNDSVDNISVAGGQEIVVKGQGFLPGAKVVFAPVLNPAGADEGNPVYKVKSENVTTPPGGSSRVLDPYAVSSGFDASVTFVDSETLKVITPVGKLKSGGLIVINPDNGVSDTFEGIKFDVPRLDAPIDVVAEKVRSQIHDMDIAIRVLWSKVEGAREYEIYVVRNGNEQFIGTTELNSYLYTDLAAQSSYKFVIKAVGSFAASDPSGESNTVRTGSNVGPLDRDGRVGEKTSINISGQVAQIKLGLNDYNGEFLFDLTTGIYSNVKEIEIAIPTQLIYYDYPINIKVVFPDSRFYFNSAVFKNDILKQDLLNPDAGVRVKIKPVKDNLNITNGLLLSTAYDIEAKTYVGQQSYNLDYLAGGISMLLNYDSNLANMRRLSKVSFNRYDILSSSWQVLSEDGSSVFRTVSRTGRYAIIGRR